MYSPGPLWHRLPTRHLSAILAADVAGYSRLMGADEERTLERLKAHRRQLVDPKIKEHHGRIVKTTGDGMLVEFPSVVDAVRCAVEMQRAMVDRNADIAEDKRITFRIGVNLGDVIAEGGDIYGDGVNIAARLEALAEPGGICISGTVRDHIRDKLPYDFEDMGEQSVKNIARPVRVYAMDADSCRFAAARISGSHRQPPDIPAAQAFPVCRKHRRRGRHRDRSLVGMASRGFAYSRGPSTRPPACKARHHRHCSAASSKTAATPRLSIVVLPFTNLSNDPDQEYFVDGITDDLTTDLSQISDSLVIARNTAFTYKGKAVDAKQLGRDLGVRYVLEGSVRRMGDQVQANVQLIDGETGAHVWADRFETDRRNLAEAQSADHRTPRANAACRTRAGRRPPDRAGALRRSRCARSRHARLGMVVPAVSVANRQEAQRAFERALEIDPRSVDARIGIALLLADEPVADRHSAALHRRRTRRKATARSAGTGREPVNGARGDGAPPSDRGPAGRSATVSVVRVFETPNWLK